MSDTISYEELQENIAFTKTIFDRLKEKINNSDTLKTSEPQDMGGSNLKDEEPEKEKISLFRRAFGLGAKKKKAPVIDNHHRVIPVYFENKGGVHAVNIAIETNIKQGIFINIRPLGVHGAIAENIQSALPDYGLQRVNFLTQNSVSGNNDDSKRIQSTILNVVDAISAAERMPVRIFHNPFKFAA